MPQHVFGIDGDGVVVDFYESAEATITLQSGIQVGINLEGDYSFDEDVRFAVLALTAQIGCR